MANKPQAVKDLLKAMGDADNKIERAFIDGLENLRKKTTIKQLEELIERRDFAAIGRILSPAAAEDSLQQFAETIAETTINGGVLWAASQPSVRGASGQAINFVAGITNPNATAAAQLQAGTRIREISNDVRAVVNEVISEGITNGYGARKTARAVRDSIGLTRTQARYVANYRAELENLQRNAIDRALRDKRSDAKILRAISEKKPLPEKYIDQQVERYRKRWIKTRAETIARTESTRAVNSGAAAGMQKYVDEGKVLPQQIRRFWHPTNDCRTRASHLTIPDLNPDGVGLDEPFKTELGDLMFPADPNGLPENTINCRCAVFNRIVSIELLEAVNGG